MVNQEDAEFRAYQATIWGASELARVVVRSASILEIQVLATILVLRITTRVQDLLSETRGIRPAVAKVPEPITITAIKAQNGKVPRRVASEVGRSAGKILVDDIGTAKSRVGAAIVVRRTELVATTVRRTVMGRQHQTRSDECATAP